MTKMTFPHMAGNAARRVSTFALCAVLGFSALAMTTGAHSAAAATDDGGIDISITVATPTPTPAVLTPAGGTGTGTGTGNGTLPSTGTGVGRGNSGPTATTTTETSPSTGTGDLGEDSTSLGGAVLLSGLTSSYDPSLNPLGGSLEVKFTVRNISDEPIDASAKFWLTTLIGTKISTEVKDVVGLEAGQSRVVTARLPGVGQWTVVTAHMTFTPPAEVGGVKLVPVSRDRIVFAEPWLLFTILLVAAGAYGVSYVLRSARTVRLPRVTA